MIFIVNKDLGYFDGFRNEVSDETPKTGDLIELNPDSQLARWLLKDNSITPADMDFSKSDITSTSSIVKFPTVKKVSTEFIFGRLVERGMNNDHLPAFEGNMRMALRAQNQCRATLETLAAIKNPPVVFAKQANINHGSGNQQVNNGTPAPDSVNSPRTEEIKSEPNQLLEVQHGSEILDTRATSATGGKDQAMATLDA